MPTLRMHASAGQPVTQTLDGVDGPCTGLPLPSFAEWEPFAGVLGLEICGILGVEKSAMLPRLVIDDAGWWRAQNVHKQTQAICACTRCHVQQLQWQRRRQKISSIQINSRSSNKSSSRSISSRSSRGTC
eukprot:366390-Chlamydomonas_euryale.AAC.20